MNLIGQNTFEQSSDARTYLRAGFAALLAGLTALGTALVGDQSIQPSEIVTVLIAAATAFGTWLGFGSQSVMEPFYGKMQEVAVPIPPAVDEPGQ